METGFGRACNNSPVSFGFFGSQTYGNHNLTILALVTHPFRLLWKSNVWKPVKVIPSTTRLALSASLEVKRMETHYIEDRRRNQGLSASLEVKRMETSIRVILHAAENFRLLWKSNVWKREL